MTAEKSEPLIFKSIKETEQVEPKALQFSWFYSNSFGGVKRFGEAKGPAPPPERLSENRPVMLELDE